MTSANAIKWFKQSFKTELENATRGTPFNASILAAIAYQETGYIWAGLVQAGKPKEDILRLCVGDTIDAGRSAFPRTKAALVAANRGNEMFAIARQALVDMAKFVPGYSGAVKNPDKFCHGYGIFQYDLQFYANDPDFFLKKQWCDASACFTRIIKELYAAKDRNGWKAKNVLTSNELVATAIAYNRGRYDPDKGLKQGYKNDEGQFYGELVNRFYNEARA